MRKRAAKHRVVELNEPVLRENEKGASE
jgi:hypothetical protein